ncbi:MAG: NFACT RNA binding domain-containing protein [Candidatus Binatia bacterium]
MPRRSGGPPPAQAGESDRDLGRWAGREVARRFLSPDGFVVLVGRSAEDNDLLTFKLGAGRDFWLHVAADSGSHVVVRNPSGDAGLPRATVQFAAGLAAGYSKLRDGGRVAVHLCTCADVSKPRGLPPGKVRIERYRTVHATPRRQGPLRVAIRRQDKESPEPAAKRSEQGRGALPLAYSAVSRARGGGAARLKMTCRALRARPSRPARAKAVSA